jgi:hypothetical protein
VDRSEQGASTSATLAGSKHLRGIREAGMIGLDEQDCRRQRVFSGTRNRSSACL